MPHALSTMSMVQHDALTLPSLYGNHLWENPGGLSNASSAYVDVVLGCCVDGKTCGS